MKKITDPKFKYTPSFATDIRRTFEKAQQRIARKAKRAAKLTEPRVAEVVELKRVA